MSDTGAMYAQVRGRITELVRDADGDTRVPACPDWTVKELLAHVTGICDDILNGRLDGVATEPWTQAQVDARKDRTVAQIVEEWGRVAPPCEAMAESFGPAATQWLSDLTTHEHDLRTALGKPGARDSDAVGIAFTWLAEMFGTTLGPRAIRLRTTEGDEVVAGTGEPAATVTADRYELFRALTGRRSREQIEAFAWDGDAGAFIEAFQWGPFRPAEASISE